MKEAPLFPDFKNVNPIFKLCESFTGFCWPSLPFTLGLKVAGEPREEVA